MNFKYLFNLQDDLVALLLNGIRYDRLDESASKTAGGYQVSLHIFVIILIICQGKIFLLPVLRSCTNIIFDFRLIQLSKVSLILLLKWKITKRKDNLT